MHNVAHVQRRRSSLRSFRIDDELLQRLKFAARREEVSENSLVERLLSQRLRLDPIYHAFQSVTVSRDIFGKILGALQPGALESIGRSMGKRSFSMARELFESSGQELGLRAYLVDILGRSGWFVVEGAEVRPEKVTLRHEFGATWSLFLKEFIHGAQEVERRTKVRMEAEDSFVGLRLEHDHQIGSWSL